ncbi:MAG: DegT/DnrJ/EryC1/StrS family aminotransferase [Thermoplasmata archaeon]
MRKYSRSKSRLVTVGELRLEGAEKKAISEVVDSNRISEGPKTSRFEEEWAKYIGTRYSVSLNSGTSALIAGLTSLLHHSKYRVSSGSKVLTTPLTYIATSNACVIAGFEPVYADIEEETLCLSPENVKSALEGMDDPSECSVLLPVHLMGYPCNMDSMIRIAQKYGLVIMEDSAQAHGTLYRYKKVGSLSALSAFSFYIAHNIQAGELGAINTSDIEICKLVRKIKTNGRMCDCLTCTRNTTGCPKMNLSNDAEDKDPRFAHEFIGYNFKAMEFQTAIALTQLKRIDRIIRKRQENVKYLNEGLESFSGIIRLPRYDKNVSYLAYPLIIEKNAKIPRKKLRLALESRGVETRPLFGCIPTQQKAYSYLKKKYAGKLPVAEYVGANGFYIGCHQYLSREDLDHVIKSFKEVLA